MFLIGSPWIHKRSWFRLFSCGPFLRLGCESSGDVVLFDAAKEETLSVPDKTLPQELDDSRLIGATRGWGLFSDDLWDRSLYITDYLNPLVASSKSKPKVIPLPPLTALYACQTQVLCNVAMSCEDDDEDWVVAIKLLGRQISLCRPRYDLRWTNILTPFTLLENSNLFYSKRDQRFYLPALGSNHLCSWDLHLKKDNNPKFHKFLYSNRPKLSQSEYELLDSCSRADHWVESPSGEERFLVKCYSYVSHTLEREPIFMVLREEETTEKGEFIMSYTEDIGDMCIFLSGSDPFCLEASLCPSLIPNSIYLMESAFGVYNIATRNICHFEDLLEGPSKPQEIEFAFVPYWLSSLRVVDRSWCTLRSLKVMHSIVGEIVNTKATTYIIDRVRLETGARARLNAESLGL